MIGSTLARLTCRGCGRTGFASWKESREHECASPSEATCDPPKRAGMWAGLSCAGCGHTGAGQLFDEFRAHDCPTPLPTPTLRTIKIDFGDAAPSRATHCECSHPQSWHLSEGGCLDCECMVGHVPRQATRCAHCNEPMASRPYSDHALARCVARLTTRALG